MGAKAWLALPLLGLACGGRAPAPETMSGELRPAMAAASGVVRGDSDKGPRDHRVIPLRPLTGDVEILYGDPDVAGQPFVMRIRELPGAVVPPHSHEVDEHITVVQGTWYFGLGETFDRDRLEELRPGTYAFAPQGTWMFGYAPDGAIVQVHGVGPFQIRWRNGLKTLDDPQVESVFLFRRGERVVGSRGAGRITEGYASGSVIQYVIEGTDGNRFMADQQDLDRQ